jgi:hypothetical protein
MNVTAKITRDNATPEVARIMAATQPARLAQVLRQPLETFWRMHLKDFPRLAGAFASFPKTGFGETASRSVKGYAQSGAVLLQADAQGLRLRYEGGTVKPVNKKFLCFGIMPESYGKTVYDFGYTPGVKDKNVNSRLRQLFAFAKQVTFRPNPDIVPSDDAFQEVAMAAITEALA